MQTFVVISFLTATLCIFVGCIKKNTEVLPVAGEWNRAIEQEQAIEVTEVSLLPEFPLMIPESEEDQYSDVQTISVSPPDEDVSNSDHLALNRLFAEGNLYADNEAVARYLYFFQTKHRRSFVQWLEKSKYYMPEIKRLLSEEDVPELLAYLPLVESGFDPNAVSHKQAVGLWQFIMSTGKNYDLKVNFWVDDRRNYEKATIAAAKYLKKLYKEFNSWELALAAYNCGERRIRKGIKKTKSNDFWVVSKTLPKETRNYVPKFIASLIIITNLEKYGFQEVIYGDDSQLVKVSVPPQKNLKDIARAVGYSSKKIISHNPFLTKKATPPGGNSYIYVEPAHVEKFTKNGQKIAGLRRTNVRKSIYATYHVRKGDNLWEIARRFGVGVNSIKRTNRLKSDLLRPGQKLTIGSSVHTIYHVRKGDNLWEIARRFGVGVNSIKKTNTLKSDLLKPGQRLTIKKSTPKPTYASARRRGDYTLYVVKKGDTIGEIAEQYGIRASLLKRYNGLDSSMIKVRQVLKIPNGGKGTLSHNIKYGDTLSEIAVKYRVSVNDIKKWNDLRTSRLTAGKKLRIYR